MAFNNNGISEDEKHWPKNQPITELLRTKFGFVQFGVVCDSRHTPDTIEQFLARFLDRKDFKVNSDRSYQIHSMDSFNGDEARKYYEEVRQNRTQSRCQANTNQGWSL